MKMKKSIGLFTVHGAAAAFLFFLHVPGTVDTVHAATDCAQSTIAGRAATGSEQSEVRKKARQNWRRQVAAKNGPSWSHWDAARVRSLNCRRTAGNARFCRAVGVPCRDLPAGNRKVGASEYNLVR